MTDMTRALAAAENQPETAFAALEALVRQTVGAALFTIMECDIAQGVARRSYSNRPDAYPVTGEKPLHDDRWSQTVLIRHQPFVANSVEEFADVFPDHALIRSLGCESCLNLPVIVAGRVLGTLNCLDVAGHYTPARVAAAEAVKVPAAAALMLAAAHRQPVQA